MSYGHLLWLYKMALVSTAFYCCPKSSNIVGKNIGRQTVFQSEMLTTKRRISWLQFPETSRKYAAVAFVTHCKECGAYTQKLSCFSNAEVKLSGLCYRKSKRAYARGVGVKPPHLNLIFYKNFIIRRVYRA